MISLRVALRWIENGAVRKARQCLARKQDVLHCPAAAAVACLLKACMQSIRCTLQMTHPGEACPWQGHFGIDLVGRDAHAGVKVY